jgi:hypothetical protein
VPRDGRPKLLAKRDAELRAAYQFSESDLG